MNVKARAVLVLVLAIVVAACGGSAGEEAPTTTATSATTTAAPATTTTPTSNPQPGSSGGVGVTGVCLEATQAMSAAMASYGAGFAGAFGGVDDDSLEAASAQLRAMAEAAPAEIRDDLRVIAEELSKLYAALDEIDYQPGTPPTPEQMAQLEALSEVIDQDAFEEAADNVDVWFDTHCGD